MAVVYEFSGFRLDPRRRQLSNREGHDVRLTPRAFDALHLLVRQPGKLVDKATFMKAIWPKVVVADNSLDQIISRLRRSFRECGTLPSLIGTERGRGYRFLAEVRTVVVPGPGPAGSSASGSALADTAQPERLYLQAVTLSVRPSADNLRAAFELLQTALALDPRCAPALAYRALLRTVSVAFDLNPADAIAAAETDARQALEIDPALASGHHGLGNVAAARGAWNEAEHHYETASRLEQEPHARVSRIYQLRQAVGHLRLSLAEAETLDRLSPSQPLGTIAAAFASMLLGRDSEALSHADRARALGWPRTNAALQDVYFQLAVRGRRFREAADCLSSALGAHTRMAGSAQAIERFCAALETPTCRPAAVTALRALIDRLRPDALGLVNRRRLLLWLTMLGALDDAFDLANASLDHFARSDMIGLVCARGLLWMPEMGAFRGDPRFQDIVARLRFADYWKRHGAPDGYALRDGALIFSEPPPTANVVA